MKKIFSVIALYSSLVSSLCCYGQFISTSPVGGSGSGTTLTNAEDILPVIDSWATTGTVASASSSITAISAAVATNAAYGGNIVTNTQSFSLNTNIYILDGHYLTNNLSGIGYGTWSNGVIHKIMGFAPIDASFEYGTSPIDNVSADLLPTSTQDANAFLDLQANNTWTDFSGTNTTFYGAFATNSVPTITGSYLNVTNLFGIITAATAATAGLATNVPAYSISDTNLSNQLFDVSPTTHQNYSVNRFAWKNTMSKWNSNNVSLLLYGTGLVSAGIFTNIPKFMLNTKISRQLFLDRNSAPRWVTYNAIDTNFIGAAAIDVTGGTTYSKDTNWLGLYTVLTASNQNVALSCPYPKDGPPITIYGVAIVTGPNAGTLNVEQKAYGVTPDFTNVFGAAINCTSNTVQSRIIWWTNAVVLPQYSQVRVRTDDNGASFVPVIGFFLATANVTNNGVDFAMIGNASSFWSTMTNIALSVELPIMQAINPDLVLFNNIDNYEALGLNRVFSKFTNLPNADVVLCGTYPTDSTNVFLADMNNRNQTQPFGYAFFDGYGPYGSFTSNTGLTNWNNRGYRSDGTHATAAGYYSYSTFLWDWLGLSYSQLKSGNYYGTFTGNGSGLTNLANAPKVVGSTGITVTPTTNATTGQITYTLSVP